MSEDIETTIKNLEKEIFLADQNIIALRIILKELKDSEGKDNEN